MANQRRPRSVITRTMKQVLAPFGFIRAKDLLVRAQGDQVHGLDVQTFRSQSEYTINITFHYSFLRGLVRFEPTPLDEFHVVDCVFRSRLGHFLSGVEEGAYLEKRGRDEWWPCFPTDTEFELLLKQRLLRSVKVLDEYAEKWSDPSYFLKLIPPEVLAEEVPIEGVQPGTPSGDSIPKVWTLMPRWCPDVFELSYCLSEIALRERQYAAVVGYADIGIAQELNKWYEPRKEVLRELRAKAIAKQSEAGKNGEGGTTKRRLRNPPKR